MPVRGSARHSSSGADAGGSMPSLAARASMAPSRAKGALYIARGAERSTRIGIGAVGPGDGARVGAGVEVLGRPADDGAAIAVGASHHPNLLLDEGQRTILLSRPAAPAAGCWAGSRPPGAPRAGPAQPSPGAVSGAQPGPLAAYSSRRSPLLRTHPPTYSQDDAHLVHRHVPAPRLGLRRPAKTPWVECHAVT